MKHKCPVCGKFQFEYEGSFDICDVYGWHDDPIQAEEPDEEGCANRMSLNQARESYKKQEGLSS